jgi:ketosteroid isomerase-like protein
MKNLSLITCLAVMLLLEISCTTPPAEPTVDLESVKTEITTINTAWAAAINSKDVEAQLALFGDDIQLMPPNKPTLKGKDAVKTDLLAEIASDTSGMKTTIAFATTDLWAAGNMATETGTWTVSAEDGTQLDKGKYIAVFEKRDGKYVCIRDIYNSDNPPYVAPMAAAATPPATTEKK